MVLVLVPRATIVRIGAGLFWAATKRVRDWESSSGGHSRRDLERCPQRVGGNRPMRVRIRPSDRARPVHGETRSRLAALFRRCF